MSYHENSPLLVTHNVNHQVEIGSCYLDGVQTTTVCFMCRRYACKAHSRDFLTRELRVGTACGPSCNKLLEEVDYTTTNLGPVCLEHYQPLQPKPAGFPTRKCTTCGKAVASIVLVFILVTGIVIAVNH